MDHINLTAKKDQDKAFIINYAPIFARLSPLEKDLITQRSKVVEYAKDDHIYRQGGPPSAFYCVISGRVRVYIGEETMEYLNCGRYFGMISTLLGESHSVSAQAASDAKILEIPQEDFKIILNKAPKLAVDLSHTLSRRLKKKDRLEKKVFESRIISVFGINLGRDFVMTYAVNLSLSLKKETGRRILLINVIDRPEYACQDFGLSIRVEYSEPAAVPVLRLDAMDMQGAPLAPFVFEDISGVSIINVLYDSADISYASRFSGLLAYFSGTYHYLVVQLPAVLNDAVFGMLNQTDIIYLASACGEPSLKNTRAMLFELFQKINSPQEKIRLILQEESAQKAVSYEEAFDLLNYPVSATLPFLNEAYTSANKSKRVVKEHPEIEYSRAIRRLSRELGGIRLGLAMGGGAAFGLAHIGIIKVLEKENIPIDMVSGTSMGALVGAMWACGIDSRGLEDIFLEYNNNRKKTYGLLMDLYLHKMSIAKGNKIRRFLTKHIGEKTFQDVRFPFRVVACNLTKRKEVVFSSGKIVDAVMASIAIPGVFAPTISAGDLIIDGGILEPVPVGTLVKAGINKIIAVNVLPSSQDISRSYEFNRRRQEEERNKAYSGSPWDRVFYNARMFFNRAFFPNVLDIIVNSMQMMEYAIAESDCQKADVLISPVAEGVDWFDFFKVEGLIKKGEEDAIKALPAIRRVLSERL